jgi:polyferredoxin
MVELKKIEKLSFIKNREEPVQIFRFITQIFFVALIIWIGVEYYLFMQFLYSGGTVEYFAKPPGVEGFLPISSFMNFYYFLKTGSINSVHPAGFFIFVGVLAISFWAGKSFCSFSCPVGFISEMVGDFGEKIEKKLFGKKLNLPKIFDIPLRSLKYIIMGFFVYSILTMDTKTLAAFLNSPYNKMADVKLWLFFAEITKFSLIVLVALVLLSVVIRNFWCRYLCPYGALLGIVSIFSPNKIKRNADTCIDCKLCTKACPSNIQVHKKNYVISDECTSCLNCVDVCPVSDTLFVQNVVTRKKISKKKIVFGIAIIYFAILGLGMLLGYWHSNVTPNEYLQYFQNINMLGH